MNTLPLSIDLINQILNYLSKKPFNEVNGLMSKIILEVKQSQGENQEEFSFLEDSEKEETEKDVTD